MNPDDRMRDALRAVADEPAPPAVTTLDDVLTRGRRRVLVQRGATIAAVVAAVAAIGVGGVVLRSAAEGQDARPAGPPSTTAPATTTTAPEAPSSVATTGTAPPEAGRPSVAVLLPGWERITVSNGQDGEFCKGGAVAGIAPDIALPAQKTVTNEFLTVVDRAAARPTLVDSRWEPYSQKTGSPRAFLDANVDMGDGPGSIQLEVDRFGGTPTAAADADIGTYGTCDAPARITLADGTVLQLNQPDFHNPDQPVQHLRVYQPNGRLYVVTSAGYGESDMKPVGGDAYTVTGGRGRLPLDDAGIAEVAFALAGLKL